MPRWFLLDDAPSNGSWNMACDEFLFANIARLQAPVLRLYSFDPPAVTIGYHQNVERIMDLALLAEDRVEIARRITGGRALYHKNEITYTVVGRDSDFDNAKTLVGSFERISRAIARALGILGIEADLHKEISRGTVLRNVKKEKSMDLNVEKNGRLALPCIASTTRFELNVAGKKIAGSAQRRAEGRFIQHGSIFLQSGSEEIEGYLGGNWRGLSKLMTTVEAEASKRVDGGEMRELLKRGFEEEFRMEFEPLVLSSEDLAEIGRLALEKAKEFENLYRR